jgi:hypothetical protein
MSKDVSLPPPSVPKMPEVPLSLAAASKLIEKHKAKGEDDILDAMVRGADNLTEAAQHITQSASKILANVMQPQIKRLSNARRRTKEISDAANKKLTDTRDRIDAAIAKLEGATLPSAPKDATAMIYAGEVRTAIAKMKPDERIKACRDAVETSDEPFIAAVITGSSMLTGMTATELEVVKDMWRRKHHSDTVERARRLRTAQAELDRQAALFTSWSGSLFVEQNAAITAAEKSAELAKAAMAEASAS